MSTNYEICERLNTLFLDGAAAVGRIVSVPKSTIAEWRGDLHRWSAEKLLALADADEPLRMALLARLGGPQANDSERPEHCVKTVVRAAGVASGAVLADLEDGGVSTAEARTHLPLVRRLSREVARLERVYAHRALDGRR